MSELSSVLAKLFHSAIIPYNPQDLLGRGRQAGLLESGVGGDGGGRSPLSGGGVTSGGTTARVGRRCTPVWCTRNGSKRAGVVEERADARARMREASKGWLERRRGAGGARAGAPVTARYGSLGDRCRYRVAVSPESVARSSLTSFARSRRPGEWKVVPLPLALAARSLTGAFTRSRHYHRRRGATGRDDSRAALKEFDRPCQTWRHRHLGGRYPGSLVTWRNGSRRGYMGV